MKKILSLALALGLVIGLSGLAAAATDSVDLTFGVNSTLAIDITQTEVTFANIDPGASVAGDSLVVTLTGNVTSCNVSGQLSSVSGYEFATDTTTAGNEGRLVLKVEDVAVTTESVAIATENLVDSPLSYATNLTAGGQATAGSGTATLTLTAVAP